MVQIAHGWDIGKHRETNEDSYLTWRAGDAGELNGKRWDAPRGAQVGQAPALCLVADGVGGAADGEVASRLAVETVGKQVVKAASENVERTLDEWQKVFEEAIESAHQAVRQEREKRRDDMSTTLVGALLIGDIALVANVGDSRAYLISPEGFRRISHDHSVVQTLVDMGEIRDSDVRTHPQRNIILRTIGGQEDMAVDIFPTPLSADETLVLCTDGVWEMMQDADLPRIINGTASLAQAADRLVALANANAGADNITVILARLTAT